MGYKSHFIQQSAPCFVMAGLPPAVHAADTAPTLDASCAMSPVLTYGTAWMAGSSPAMTKG